MLMLKSVVINLLEVIQLVGEKCLLKDVSCYVELILTDRETAGN